MYEDKFKAAFGMSFEELLIELNIQQAIEKEHFTKDDTPPNEKVDMNLSGKECLLKFVSEPDKLAESKVSETNDINHILKVIVFTIEQLNGLLVQKGLLDRPSEHQGLIYVK